MRYRVYVNFSVSQVVEVEADSIDEAMDAAYDNLDEPNSTNKFEMDSEPDVVTVMDENGDELWRQP